VPDAEVDPAVVVAADVEGAASAGATPTASAAYSRSTPGRLKVKPNSLLAGKADTEYVYVRQDLRRIAIVGASLFGVLILLWLLLVVLGLSGLY
jgi:hypothetical protein